MFTSYFISVFVQLQKELSTWQGEGADVIDSQRAVFSPQDAISRSPHSFRTSSPVHALPTRSHSDSEAVLEEQGSSAWLKGPTENLFLDALTLDPLRGLEVPPPSRLDSEKKFPCMKEVKLGKQTEAFSFYDNRSAHFIWGSQK